MYLIVSYDKNGLLCFVKNKFEKGNPDSSVLMSKYVYK